MVEADGLGSSREGSVVALAAAAATTNRRESGSGGLDGGLVGNYSAQGNP